MAGLPLKNGTLHDIYMNSTKGATLSSPDIRMVTAKGTMSSDISMQTARGDTTIRGGQFKPWERELLDAPEVRRKATAAQLCEFYCILSFFHRLSEELGDCNNKEPILGSRTLLVIIP